MTHLTPEDLLLGAANTFEVEIPSSILYPGGGDGSRNENSAMVIQLRPLTIGTFQLIMKASRQDVGLIPLLMIKESLIEPSLSLEQVKQLHLGLVNFLIENIRQISGLTGKKNLSSM
jgi:hypothetical protein